MKKVLILHNIISPIRIFLFNELSNHYKAKGVALKVIFLSVSDKNRNWKVDMKMNFDYEILKNIPIRVGKKDLFTFFINPSILKMIRRENPDKIISFGWDNLGTYIANWWCRKNNKSFVLWSGSTKYEKSWRRTLFNPLVKYLINRTTSFIAYGTRAKEYLLSLGANQKKIQIFYNTIDSNYFKDSLKNFNTSDKKALRKKLNIQTNKVIMFNGQLIERKGIFELLLGFANYQKKYPDVSLLLVGNGREKERIKTFINRNLIHNIIFADFIQYHNIYKYYAISDLLILPSREEVWGLVINEALACGVPVITTEETGASVDLIKHGKNGYIIHSNCPDCITKMIIATFNNTTLTEKKYPKDVTKSDIAHILKNTNL